MISCLEKPLHIWYTSLEWSYQAGETDVRAETLAAAASLLVLRRDTLRIIDGTGPSAQISRSDPERGTGTEPERAVEPQGQVSHTTEAEKEQVQTRKNPQCAFSGVVSIELTRFLDSGVTLVECPDCTSTRTLSPHKGVVRFPSHDQRKTRTTTNEQRWARGDTTWEAVGGERK